VGCKVFWFIWLEIANRVRASLREPCEVRNQQQLPHVSWYVLGMASSTAARRGRRSLSAAGDSPQIRVRVPVRLRELAEERARREKTTVSEIVRDALEQALRPRRREERVQLELHRALLANLITDPERVRALAQRNLAKSRTLVRGDQARGWLDEWRRLLDGPPEQLIDVLLAESEHAIDLRQVSPFVGALGDAERLTAIQRANSHATR